MLNKSITVNAYTEQNYQNAGMNFLQNQYNSKEIIYSDLSVKDTVNLYDFDDVVTAKLMIVNRDNELDYVILDFLADDIIAYGFNSKDYVQKFYGKGKIYYAGKMTFAYIDNDQYFDIDGNKIDVDTFVDVLFDYRSVYPKTVTSPYGGILSWEDVRKDVNVSDSSISEAGCDYIPGFSWYGLTGNSYGRPGNYFSQSEFNNNYNLTHTTRITDTCGPTAMTNMAVYFNWLGYNNALINGSAQSTFEWFIEDSNWHKWQYSSWWTNTKNSFVNYAKNRGYSYDITNYDSPSIDNFIDQIRNDRPIYTYINVKVEDTTKPEGYRTWAHAVVTVGFEKFTHTYKVNEKWWLFGWHDKWVTKKEDYFYLRCIDGWDSSNSAQYIKYNFYDTYLASAFKLK